MIHNSSESLLTIINDILDFSKIEAGKMEMESIAVQLRESLDETLRLLGFARTRKGLELVTRCSRRSGALMGDPGRIRQILINLVGNAIKFTERGEICVRVERKSRAPNATCSAFCGEATPASASRRKNRRKSLKRSRRQTARWRESTAARDWGWPFVRGW